MRPADDVHYWVATGMLAATLVAISVRLFIISRRGHRPLPAFDAASVVEALEYTLHPFSSAKGVIKEPSDGQIGQFLATYKEITAEVRKNLPTVGDDPDNDALMDAMEQLDPEVYVAMSHRIAEAFSVLCSGSPSKEDLLAVPPRRRNLFYQWLQKETMDPEAVTDAGKQQASTQRR